MNLVTALTWVLPHRLLSSLARALAYSDNPRTRSWLIDTVTRRFGVDLSEAQEPDPAAGRGHHRAPGVEAIRA